MGFLCSIGCEIRASRIAHGQRFDSVYGEVFEEQLRFVQVDHHGAAQSFRNTDGLLECFPEFADHQ
ncbi:MAG TPA: hypothetical protein DCY59_10285 [Micrococcaceae bacterium]|nr:hypothetical protein [Micrococcaceae bacterium]